RRLVKSFPENLVYASTCVRCITTQLFFRKQDVGKRKPPPVIVSGLFLHFRIVKASAVETGRCTCFHSSGFKAKADELFRQACCGFFARSASAKTFFADVNNAVQESAVRENH